MKTISLDTSLLENHIQAEEIGDYRNRVEEIHQRLQTSEENLLDLLGWHHHPLSDHSEMLQSINDIAQEIKMNADILIVIGVGGSFLGARAVQEALTPYFGSQENSIEVIFTGQNMSGAYLKKIWNI